MSEPKGEGKLRGVRKESHRGNPKSKEEGRLGHYRSGESQGGGQGRQGERASYCSLGSTLDQRPLSKDKVMDFYSLLRPCPLSFPPAPVSLWGYPHGWSAYLLLLRSDVIWKVWVGG